MIGIDTNVLLRYLAQDDVVQTQRANELFARLTATEEFVLINDAILLELAWVLRSTYRLKREAIAEYLERVISTRIFVFHDLEVVAAALIDYRNGRADFADYLIGRRNAAAGCEHTVTFDKALADSADFVIL